MPLDNYEPHTAHGFTPEASKEHIVPNGSHAWEHSGWHGGCKGVKVVQNPASGRGLSLVCEDCRVVADYEAVASRITFDSSYAERSSAPATVRPAQGVK